MIVKLEASVQQKETFVYAMNIESASYDGFMKTGTITHDDKLGV